MGSTRRRVLTGAAALAGTAAVLAGCTSGEPEPPPPTAPPPPDALEPLLAETRALADDYRAALTLHPALTAELTPLLEAHTAHAAALSAIMTPPPSPLPSTGAPTGAASGTPTGAASGTPSPTATSTVSPDATIARLRAAEQTARQTAATACAGAPAERAALLGSIAAARATHAEVLG